MPLVHLHHPFPDATFGLWQIAEEEAFFRQELPLSATEEQEFATLQHPQRRLEWLAGRYLLHKITGTPQRLVLEKTAFSKPFFPENQHLGCSLSHSRGNVGALIVQSPAKLPAVGCDIQVQTPKMARIAPKFLNQPEQEIIDRYPESTQQEYYHLVWTAKESLYKAYGLKELDFRQHLFVTRIEWDGTRGRAIGEVSKGDFAAFFNLFFQKYILPENAGEIIACICTSR